MTAAGQMPGRILGIDYGSRRVGLAVSDPLRIIAQGVGTVDNDPKLYERIAAVIREQEVALILVGMPYAPDGGEGGKGGEVRAFIENLRRSTVVPIETWDESFSSVNARGAMIASGMKRKKRRIKGRVDEMAARLLIEEYLENHHS
jgi:putative Holliday junction resolvase